MIELADYIPLNGCTACGIDFTSLVAFDRHRVGAYGPGEYHGPVVDWTPELGRRCLDSDELREAGLERLSPGDAPRYDSRVLSGVPLYWIPKDAERARRRFSAPAEATDADAA